VEGEDGRTCILHRDLNRLEEHLLQLSPADKDIIQEMIRVALLFTKLPHMMEKAPELYSLTDGVKMVFKMLPFFKDFRKYGQITVGDFASQFKDPLIRDALLVLLPGYTSMIFWFFVLSSYHNKDAGFPLGGSLEFSKSIAKRYTDLGGQIHYKAKVDKILVNKDQAVGIRLSDGTEVYGDYILPAMNSYSTMFKLLEGQFVDEKLKGYFETLPTPTFVQVSLGVDYELSTEPHCLIVKLSEPVTVGGQTVNYVSLRHYCYDKSLSPSGKSVVVSLFKASYAYWEKLADKPEEYEAEKKKFADLVIQELVEEISRQQRESGDG